MRSHLCAFCIQNQKFYIMHYLWVSSSILSRTILLCFFVWSILSFMCLDAQSFRFGILCHHEKFGEFGFLLEPCSFWELVLSHSLFHDLTILEWDKSLSICIFIYLLLLGFCLVHLLNLWSFMCWIGSLIQFGHRLSCHTLVCAI